MTSVSRSYTQKTNHGFTIVELLIVIVVIGILAAIVIVAFNGVQQRAQLTSVKSNLNGMGKLVSLYEAEGSGFPTNDTDVKAILQKSNLWQATRSPMTKDYLFCANASTYAIIVQNSPGVTAYNTANATVNYWSSDGGLKTYVNTTGDAAWTANCNLALGTMTWRQQASAIPN